MPKTYSKLRSRMITVRLSEKEFDILSAACDRHGRSISEFARAALLDAASPEADGPFANNISKLGRKLSDLDSTFTQLVDRIETLNRIADTRGGTGKDGES